LIVCSIYLKQRIRTVINENCSFVEPSLQVASKMNSKKYF